MTDLALTYDEQRRLLAWADQGQLKLAAVQSTLGQVKARVDTITTPEIDYDLLAQKIYALQQSHGGISDIDVDRVVDGVLDRMSVRLAQ